MTRVLTCAVALLLPIWAYASHGQKPEGNGQSQHSEPQKEKKEKSSEHKAVRVYREQEAKVKKLRTYIKMDEEEIAKCKKKDISPEERIACPRNIDYYKARIEQTRLKLKDAELKLRIRKREAKRYLEDENGEDKSLIIKGNEIRSIIRTADGKNILWSTMFEVSINADYVILSGKGFGHGVGLCQWGAIALSQNRWSYKGILVHYFPGTTVEGIND